MATLNIGGKRVKVDDAFLSMTPEQQNATVEEIAGQIGAGAPVTMSGPPMGAKPGSKEYALWARDQAIAGKELPQVSPDPNIRDNPGSILDPFVQGTTFGWADEARGAVQGGIAAMQGKDFGETYRNVVDESRQSLAQERKVNPIGSFAAETGGAITSGLLAARALGPAAGAIGLSAPATLGGRVAMGALSGGAQGATYGAGASDGDLQDRAKGGAVGALVGGGVGAAVPLIGNAVSNFVQKAQQGRVLDAAAKVAPTADDLRSAASKVFEQATDVNPLAISDNAYFRFLGDVQSAGKRLRINANLDPKSVGLSELLTSIGDDLARGGTVVDMKDLHLLRQAAQRVAMSSDGRDAAFAKIVISNLDDFVQTLKPADILGGADPTQAANGLMRGISTWSRANKVGLIEEAIRVGQGAAAGPEKGIRNALRSMVFRNPDVWRRFSAPEQQAIKDVIDGTAGSNLMKLIGTFGFGGNSATNGIGGAAGMALGGMAGGPVGMVAGPVIGAIGRKASEKMTEGLANRAMGVVATEGLKALPPVNPNVATPLEMLLQRALTPNAGRLVPSR